MLQKLGREKAVHFREHVPDNLRAPRFRNSASIDILREFLDRHEASADRIASSLEKLHAAEGHRYIIELGSPFIHDRGMLSGVCSNLILKVNRPEQPEPAWINAQA